MNNIILKNLGESDDLDDPAGFYNPSAQSTPKIHPFPVTENISDILEKRSNFSVIKGGTPESGLSSSFTSAKPSFTRLDSNLSHSSYMGSHSPVKSWQITDNFNSKPGRAKNTVGTPIIRLAIDKMTTLDANELMNNPKGTSPGDLNKNTPSSSPYKKSMTVLSKLGTPALNKINKSSPSSWTTGGRFADDYEGRTEITSFGHLEGFNHMYDRSPSPSFYSSAPYYSGYRHSYNRCKEYLLNENVLSHILPFLSYRDLVEFSSICHEFRNQKKYKIHFKERLNKLLLRGLSIPEQIFFWNSCIKFKELKQAHPTSFTQNFVRECSYIKDIKKDVDRTLPEYDKYSTDEGKSSLLRVLVAVSNSIKDVGYIQGLNSIAGVFLFYLKEEQSFWATLYLLEKLNVKDLLKEGFKTIHVLNYQFEIFLQNYIPHIANHLKFQSITLSYITTPWFITLYSYFLSLPKILKLWNFFFLKGPAFLIQFGLAVFSHYQNQILAMEPDEVPNFLKIELRELSDYDDSLFARAMEFKVTRKMLREFAYYYDQGKPSLILTRDLSNKSKWEVSLTHGDPKINDHSRKSRDIRPNNQEGRPILTSNHRQMSCDNIVESKANPSKFQDIINTIKVDLPGSFKNIFKKKQEDPSPEHVNLNSRKTAKASTVEPQTTSYSDLIKVQPIEKEKEADHTIKMYKPPEPNWNEHYRYHQADLYVDNRIHTGGYAPKITIDPEPMRYTNRTDNHSTSLSPNGKRSKTVTRSPSLMNSSWAGPKEHDYSMQTSLKSLDTSKGPEDNRYNVNERYLSIISLSKLEPVYGASNITKPIYPAKAVTISNEKYNTREPFSAYTTSYHTTYSSTFPTSYSMTDHTPYPKSTAL